MSTTPANTRCRNCGAALHGRYCHECGQDAQSKLRSLRAWLAEMLDEVVGLDSRVLSSLRLLLVRPGQLTLDWAAGRWQRHLSPMRLFLLATALFFAVFLQLGFPIAELRPIRGDDELAFMRQGVLSELRTVITIALIAAVPFLALVLKLLYGRSRYFVECLVFSLHVHAFAFIVLTIAWIALFGGPPGFLAALLLLIVPLVYLFFAMQRVYGAAPGTTVRYFLVVVVAVVSLGATAATIAKQVSYRSGQLFAQWEAAQARAAERKYTSWRVAQEEGAANAGVLLTEAVRAYEGPATARHIRNDHELFHAAQLYHASGDTAKARSLAAYITKRSPEYLLAIALLADLADARGDVDAAGALRARFVEVYERDGLRQEAAHRHHKALFDAALQTARR